MHPPHTHNGTASLVSVVDVVVQPLEMYCYNMNVRKQIAGIGTVVTILVHISNKEKETDT